MKRKVPASRIDEVVYNSHEFCINTITREIYLHGQVHYGCDDDGYCGIDYRSATTFIKNLTLLDRQSHDDIVIHMVSGGGDWNYGMAIYDAIRSAKSHVTIIAYAHARSMTSIILQAADTRVLMPNCIVLLHHGWLGTDDRCEAVVSQVDQCKIEMKAMVDIFVDKCCGSEGFDGKKPSQVRSFINRKLQHKQDWILDADQAIYYGLADIKDE